MDEYMDKYLLDPDGEKPDFSAQPPMDKPLLEIKNERLSFFTQAGEVKALNDISLHLSEGEVLGVVGESGRASCRERV